ncbi:S-Ena type endospore appendage [Cytobacillus horneckiae]
MMYEDEFDNRNCDRCRKIECICHKPKPEKEEKKSKCHKVCGNILLNDRTSIVEIWNNRSSFDTIVTASIFNSAASTSSIKVVFFLCNGDTAEIIVPVGNTISTSIEEVCFIQVSRVDGSKVDGRFCLDICFLNAYLNGHND